MERVGIVLGADGSQFRREFASASREIEKLDRVLNRGTRGTGVLSKKDAREYDTQLTRVRQNVNRLTKEYAFTTQELRKLEAEQQKLLSTGNKLTLQQKEQLQTLQTAARAQHHALTSAQQQSTGLEQQRAGMKVQGRFGAAVSKAGAYMATRHPYVAAASMVLGWGYQKSEKGTATLIQNQLALEATERMGGYSPRDRAWGAGRRNIASWGRHLGYTTAETYGLYQGLLQASGKLSPLQAMTQMSAIRGFHLDPGTFQGYMSATRHAGGLTGGAQPTMNLLQGRQYGGFARALGNEFATSVSGILSSVSSARERTSATTIPGLIGFLGRGLGGAFQQSPQRTAELASGLHGTITAPGGGEAGQAFMLRAMGFGKGASYIEALERMEKGVADPENIKRMLSQTKAEYQGQDNQALALNKLSGGQIKIWQARRLLGLSTEGLTDKGIAGAMEGEKVDLGKEVKESRQRTGLTRREIAMREKEASLRATADPAYALKHKLEIAGIDALTEAIKSLTALFKGDFKKFFKGTIGQIGKLLTFYQKTEDIEEAGPSKPRRSGR